MDNNNKDIFVDDLTFNQKNSNFSTSEVKNKTIDFLSNETFEDFHDDEKTDVKEKKNVDDFLNFHEESYQQQDELLKSNPILLPTIEKQQEEIQEVPIDTADSKVQEDEFLNPYAMTKESNNEKFISSEDLLTSEFKDTIPTEEEVIPEEPPKIITPPTIVEEAVKVEEPKQAAVILDPRPKETQIEAEKMFTSIGLGMSNIFSYYYLIYFCVVDGDSFIMRKCFFSHSLNTNVLSLFLNVLG